MYRYLVYTVLVCFSLRAFGQSADIYKKIDAAADKIEAQTISWRRDFHLHPELGNHEVRTSKIIADYLRSLGIDVKDHVGVTGVVGILKGGKPGPVIALRADMDGLPVKERTNVPFASKDSAVWGGKMYNVMHACGHDSHMAILLSVAEILSSIKQDIRGTVKFIFQPAEEGVPPGEEGGAELMIKEGVMENPKVDVVFGLHINSQTPVGKITYRPGATMAGVDNLHIVVRGKSAHGAYPWSSVDPIVTSAQIITGLQTVVSRSLNVTENPGVVTIGAIHGGNRTNIIPEEVDMLGTVRYFSKSDQHLMEERIRTIVTKTAEAAGATATVDIPYNSHYPVTFNDPALVASMLPSLQKVAGSVNVQLKPVVTGAEDFSYYEEKVPGIFFFLGGMPAGQDPLTAPSHHTPDFFIDESGFKLGVRAFCRLVIDYPQTTH